MSDRSVTILAILLVSLVLGSLLYSAYLDKTPARQTTVNSEKIAEPERLTRVIAKSTSCTRIAGRTQIKGYIENTGNVSLSMVTVQPVWKNAAGLIVGRGLVFVVNQDEPLEPGQRRDFVDVTQLSNITRCNVETLDWSS